MIKTLCKFVPTYSIGARQIYFEGKCHFATSDSVIFFANSYDFTKTFSRIPSGAVKKTGIHIYSQDENGLAFLQSKRGQQSKVFQFGPTLTLIMKNIDNNTGFIPILQKSSIKDSANRRPLIEVSSLDISQLKDEFSEFELSMIMSAVKRGFSNLESLYRS